MEQVLYADILFFVNFSMDFITLYLTARLTSGPPGGVRSTVAAVIGGIYGTVAVAMDIDGIAGVLAAGAVSVGMVAIALGYNDATTLLRRSAVFWGFAALLGGVMTAICSFGGSFGAPGSPAGGTALLFIGSTVCLLFMKLFSRFSRRKTATVRIELNGKSAQFTALCDSGNLATDPLSARPVILADKSVLSTVMPVHRTLLGDIPEQLSRRLRMIPVKGIGGGGLLTGFIPDSIWVTAGGKEKRCDAVIALTDSGNTFFGGYPANIPQSLL